MSDVKYLKDAKNKTETTLKNREKGNTIENFSPRFSDRKDVLNHINNYFVDS